MFKELYQKSALNQLIAGSFIFVCLVGSLNELFLIMPNGSIYAPASTVVILIGLAKLIDTSSGSNSEILSNSDYFRYNFVSITILAPLGIATNLLLIPKLGLTGAAWASLITMFLVNAFRFFIIYWKLKMIPFFRKVRKKLADNNKPLKYLRYAIGEIVLVVIGILIALSINNWNENKKNVNQSKKHLETISLNLKDDIKQAEILLAETNTTIEYTDTLLSQFKTIKPVDINIQMYLIYLMYERNLEVNESGFNALLNSNGMSFIDENLQVKILDYYRRIEQLKSREINANSEIKAQFEPYVKSNYYWIYNKTNPWHRQSELYKDDPRPIENINLNSIITDKRLEIMVNGRKYQSTLLSDFYSRTISLAKEIVTEIEK